MAELGPLEAAGGLAAPGGFRLPRLSAQRIVLLWLPAAAVTAAVVLPVVYLVLRASEAGPATWDLLSRPQTARILGNSVGLAASVTAASWLLGASLALLTVRTDLPFRRFFAIAAALPLAVPSYVGAYLLAAALGPRGLLQEALEPVLGVTRLPSIYGFPGAFLALTLLSYPYVLLPVRAALQRMDPALEESARSLGHNTWGVLRRVTLPHLVPALLAGGLLVALYSLRDFGAVSLLRFTTFTRAIYIQYQSAFDRSSAAALSLVLVALTVVLLAMELRARHGEVRYASTGIGGKTAQVIRLGHWRWLALAYCLALVGVALVLPTGVLAYWLLRALQAGPELPTLLEATGHSLLASALAALATVVAALPIVILSVRYPSDRSRWLDRLAHIGFALPGVVVALALVFFGLRGAPWLYQTLPMLVLAYLVLFLPQATASLRSSLIQIPRQLEESGRSLGRQPLAVFHRVTLPLLRPGLMASAALVFLTTMKELQATLLLGPLGFRTLSTEIWSAVSEAFFAEAAGPALVLILTCSIPMAYFILRDQP